MRTPNLCIHCGQNGTVRRDATIKGPHTMIVSYCTVCARRWENSDQRRMPPTDLDEPRERRIQPR